MSALAELAPGIPPDYYRRIYEAEQRHWWYRGMRTAAASLLGDRLRAGGRVLDGGCGTGGFLRFLLDEGRFDGAAGVDVGSAAIALARERVPEAELHVAPLRAIPFEDATFALAVSNDVLQHVPEDDMAESLAQLRRVLEPGGALLLRTNGSRHFRRERDDWRAYDRETLRAALAGAGFRIETITFTNCLLSLVSAARGVVPHAPSDERHGIPMQLPSRFRSAVGTTCLALERPLLRRGAVPYGHTLLTLAVPTTP